MICPLPPVESYFCVNRMCLWPGGARLSFSFYYYLYPPPPPPHRTMTADVFERRLRHQDKPPGFPVMLGPSHASFTLFIYCVWAELGCVRYPHCQSEAASLLSSVLHRPNNSLFALPVLSSDPTGAGRGKVYASCFHRPGCCALFPNIPPVAHCNPSAPRLFLGQTFPNLFFHP